MEDLTLPGADRRHGRPLEHQVGEAGHVLRADALQGFLDDGQHRGPLVGGVGRGLADGGGRKREYGRGDRGGANERTASNGTRTHGRPLVADEQFPGLGETLARHPDSTTGRRPPSPAPTTFPRLS